MDALGSAYAFVVTALCVHGAHRYVHAWRFARHRNVPPAMASWHGPLPSVTVQLPVFNERDVVGRLVDAVAALDWPRERLQIQLLDDSTDDTASCAAAAIARARASGIEVEVLHRHDRVGFKAGALSAGLRSARGEFIAIFDADFSPAPDFLRRTILPFADPGIGMVQARWGHLNAGESVLTRAQSLMLDAHFRVEHLSRNRSGAWFNFNGTAGIWRRTAIELAGGWQGDTLTEDLDLSYRAQVAGCRFVYLDDVVVPAEVPSTLAAFRSQQARWAKGSLETAKKLTGLVARSSAPTFVRVEALQHLWANLAWPLALLVALLMPAVAIATPTEGWARHLFLDLPAFVFATASHTLFFSLPAFSRRRTRPFPWRDLPVVLALGTGMALAQSVAVFEALRGRRSGFVRTPKRGDGFGSYRVADAATGVPELVLAAWHVVGIVGAISLERWGSIPFLTLFAVGFGWVGIMAVRERWAPVATVASAEAVLAK